MKEIFKLSLFTDQSLWLTPTSASNPIRVCTVTQAAQLLHRSQRQIYRYIETQKLIPVQKVLNEWILDYQSVQRLATHPPLVQKIPERLRSYFPEYELSHLNAGEARSVVMERLLELGGIEEARWLIKRYDQKELATFVMIEGSRRLSSRSLRFWSLFFRVTPKPSPHSQDPVWKNR